MLHQLAAALAWLSLADCIGLLALADSSGSLALADSSGSLALLGSIAGLWRADCIGWLALAIMKYGVFFCFVSVFALFTHTFVSYLRGRKGIKYMWAILCTIGFVLLLLAFIQQQCNKHKWTPPSAYLSRCAAKCNSIWEYVGTQLAHLGTWIVLIKDAVVAYFKDFLPALEQILEPIVELLISFRYLFKGFYTQVKLFIQTRLNTAFYQNRCVDILLLILGTFTFFSVFVLLCICTIYPQYWSMIQTQLVVYSPLSVSSYIDGLVVNFRGNSTLSLGTAVPI